MTQTLIAKPIKPNEHWIVTDGSRKIGNIQASTNGFSVELNGKHMQFVNIVDIQRHVDIRFDNIDLSCKPVHIADLKLPFEPHSVFLDVSRNIYVFSKEKDSKCLYAAGWFFIKNKPHYCPKYMLLKRYPFNGPYETKEQCILKNS